LTAEDGDFGTAFGEHLSGGGPDSAATSGDEGHFVDE
jgi:hypothetical protein